jgi:pSer/pThr/pTyr-binding forkhead associated (FHA) protein
VARTLRIGRGPECEISLPGDSAPGVHAVLSVEDGRVSLAEGSDGGTWLVRDGHRYSISVPVELMAGDRIEIGEAALGYEELLQRAGIATPRSPAQRAVEPRNPGARVLRVGRGPGCEVVVDDPSVAPLHAVLEVESEGRIHLRDLPGNSGVVLVRDGRRIRVKDQIVLLTDTLEFGEVEIGVGDLLRRAVASTGKMAAVPPVEEPTPSSPMDTTQPVIAQGPADAGPGPALAGLVLVLALTLPWPGATWPARLLVGGLVGALVLWLASFRSR